MYRKQMPSIRSFSVLVPLVLIGPVPTAWAAEAGGLADPRPSTGPGAAPAEVLAVQLPQGRSGLAPELSFRHTGGNSTATPWLGLGWSMDIGSLTRHNQRGGPPLGDYSHDGRYTYRYQMTVFGSGGELTEAPPYWQDSLAIAFTGRRDSLWAVRNPESTGFNGWTVDDGAGRTLHYFGHGIQGLADEDGNVQYLESIVNQDSRLLVNYRRPDAELWSGQDVAMHAVYPESITFGHARDGGPDGHFRVRFLYEPRPDPIVTARTGHLVAWRDRLTELSVEAVAPDATVTVIRRYLLGYELDPQNGRSLMTSVQVVNSSGVGDLAKARISAAVADLAKARIFAAGGRVIGSLSQRRDPVDRG